MKLLYGTLNPSKLQHMREMLQGLDIEIIGLIDVGIDADIEESGTSPLENARIKAMGYYKLSGIPTFSCDSGLYIDGLKDEKQPGVHVRRVNNHYMNDEESIEYYSKLVHELGCEPKSKFKNAICMILDENNIFEYDGDDIADHFLMTSKPHPKRKPGFPMDSISLDIESRQYLVDIYEHSRNEKEITEGFRNFFLRTVLKGK
jgi:8-oxo-dGTP diphosphatase